MGNGKWEMTLEFIFLLFLLLFPFCCCHLPSQQLKYREKKDRFKWKWIEWNSTTNEAIGEQEKKCTKQSNLWNNLN